MKTELKLVLLTEIAKTLVAVLDADPAYKGWRQDLRATLEKQPINFSFAGDINEIRDIINEEIQEVAQELNMSDGLPPRTVN